MPLGISLILLVAGFFVFSGCKFAFLFSFITRPLTGLYLQMKYPPTKRMMRRSQLRKLPKPLQQVSKARSFTVVRSCPPRSG